LDENEYMAFGISGSESSSQMVGADVAVAYYSPAMQRGLATDYNITAQAPVSTAHTASRANCVIFGVSCS
jgi:hypothetical protein